MFDELRKYKQKGNFTLISGGILKDVCNAPNDKSGIYIVYAINNSKIELIYIGRSGKHNADGSMQIRKAGLGGIKDRIVNGHQFGKVTRHKSWITQMNREGIETLDVYWYVTHDADYSDCPKKLERHLLQKYLQIYGRLPKWNKEL